MRCKRRLSRTEGVAATAFVRPHDELHGAKEGDEVWIDLRNPKALLLPD